jgi:hypothetical protein
VAELRVPATKVARRAVDGVAVLLKLYAHCIDGQADAVDKRAGSLLGELKSVIGFSIGLVGRTRPDHGPTKQTPLPKPGNGTISNQTSEAMND